jgi:hypothetical protein
MGYYKDRAIDIAEFVDELVSYKRSRDYIFYALTKRFKYDQLVEYGMDIYDEKRGGK